MAKRRTQDGAQVRLKRVYEEPATDDGIRVLADRLWPRGLTKERAAIDHWVRELAPTTELRKWFGHEVTRWEEFRARYRAELEQNREPLEALEGLLGTDDFTIVFAARDRDHNQGVVLAEVLEQRAQGRARAGSRKGASS